MATPLCLMVDEDESNVLSTFRQRGEEERRREERGGRGEGEERGGGGEEREGRGEGEERGGGGGEEKGRERRDVSIHNSQYVHTPQLTVDQQGNVSGNTPHSIHNGHRRLNGNIMDK